MIDSMSRWFVGSSISRTSGLPSSTRAIATRIFQPPESAPDVAVDPLVVEAEAVQHLARLRLERVAAEVVVLLLHLRRSASRMRSSSSARAGIGHRVLQRLELVVQVADAAAAGDRLVEHRAARHLLDVLAEVADRELLRAPTPRPRRATPRRRSCGTASSCRSRSGPTRPTFSPGLSWKEASTKRICRPYCFETEEGDHAGRSSVSQRIQGTYALDPARCRA